MKPFKDLLALTVAGLLVACVIAAYLTRDASTNRIAVKKLAAGSDAPPVDERMLQTAIQMASIADTTGEQALAAEAFHLADHELDQAFGVALREAAAATPQLTGPLKQLADRVTQLNQRIANDQERVARLTKEAASNASAADPLEVAKAQLALDQDELEDAQQNLATKGGDRRATLQRALQQHEDVQHRTEQVPKAAATRPTATMSEQLQVWLSLGNRERQLDASRSQATDHAGALSREHDTLENLINNKPVPAGGAAPVADSSDNGEQEDPAAMMARLRSLSDQRKTLTALGQRIQDSQQLAETYKRWSGVVGTRRRSVLHLLLRSLAIILAVLLAVILIDRVIRHAFGLHADRKRLRQLRVVASIGVQLVGVLVILLIIFGPPNQTPTIIGLATAGLTVALKDFIVAFFGWFALMGRNGIRVGDWVEINGVGGEVIEIGILKTVLLEMGNWASTGHPTGRRVSFVNSYAIEGHYFNFSTAGQWLWDELQVTLPPSGDPYQMAEQIRQAVERETEADAKAAEQEWERVTRQYGTRPFSGKPAVDLRPSVNGLNVIVRYITHAPQRYEVKSRLFTAIVGLLHKPAGSTVTPS